LILAPFLISLPPLCSTFPFFFPPSSFTSIHSWPNASLCDVHGSDVHAVGIADLRPALFGIICASCGVW
jgi:hypothetical protein